MIDRRFFISRGGDRLELGNRGSDPVLLGRKTSGFGLPAKETRLVRGPATGASYRGTRTDTRKMDLHVHFLGANRAEWVSYYERLCRIMSPGEGRALPLLSVEFADGSAWELPLLYQSGLEGATGSTHAEAVLSCEATAPHWVARDARQLSAATTQAAVGLLPELSKLRVMSSSTLGSVAVENPGDVDSPLTWTITGPGGPASASMDGRGWTFTGALKPGEVVTIDGASRTVRDSQGRSRYGEMGAAPKFFTIPPGRSTVQIEMANTAGGSRIAGFYQPRRETLA